jgi:translation initiation factor 3 subunit F
VNLRLDTSLQQDQLPCQAYVSRALQLGDKPLATGFVEVPCDVQYGDVERVGGEQCYSSMQLSSLVNL